MSCELIKLMLAAKYAKRRQGDRGSSGPLLSARRGRPSRRMHGRMLHKKMATLDVAQLSAACTRQLPFRSTRSSARQARGAISSSSARLQSSARCTGGAAQLSAVSRRSRLSVRSAAEQSTETAVAPRDDDVLPDRWALRRLTSAFSFPSCAHVVVDVLPDRCDVSACKAAPHAAVLTRPARDSSAPVSTTPSSRLGRPPPPRSKTCSPSRPPCPPPAHVPSTARRPAHASRCRPACFREPTAECQGAARAPIFLAHRAERSFTSVLPQGTQGALVEILVPELFDQTSGNIMREEGDQQRVWEARARATAPSSVCRPCLFTWRPAGLTLTARPTVPHRAPRSSLASSSRT